MILKGPGTLFIKKSKKVVESYNKILDQSSKEFREILVKNKIDFNDYNAQFEVQNKNYQNTKLNKLKIIKELYFGVVKIGTLLVLFIQNQKLINQDCSFQFYLGPKK